MSGFPNTLKSLRIREGLSQEELANKLNTSRSSVAMYEQGKREPGLESMEEIADLFNVDMNYLTGRLDNNYYADLQTRQIAQEIFDNSELKILFEVARNATPENLLYAADLLSKLNK